MTGKQKELRFGVFTAPRACRANELWEQSLNIIVFVNKLVPQPGLFIRYSLDLLCQEGKILRQQVGYDCGFSMILVSAFKSSGWFPQNTPGIFSKALGYVY